MIPFVVYDVAQNWRTAVLLVDPLKMQAVGVRFDDSQYWSFGRDQDPQFVYDAVSSVLVLCLARIVGLINTLDVPYDQCGVVDGASSAHL